MATECKRTVAEQLECVDELRLWAKSRIEHCRAQEERSPQRGMSSVWNDHERRTLEAVLRILDGGDGDGD